MRVLVIDDQPDARTALCDLLAALGVGAAAGSSIDQADDGDTALRMVEAATQEGRPYDLLLIDWVMPRLDGEGLLRSLRSAGRTGGPLPVIVSAYDSEVIHSKAQELGARHFLPKPVLPESLRELVGQLAGSADRQPAGTAAPTVDLSGFRILVVEDNPTNQQLASELLESRGAAVDVAANGQEAIDRLKRLPPDHYALVLMDLQMPVLDGYEATRLLRIDERFVNLPIIAMTAHAMAEERERCQVLGMNGHISKPIDPGELYAIALRFRAVPGSSRPGPTTPPAPRGIGAPSAGDAETPRIAGLDVDAGLRHAGGSRALYRRLLKRFAGDYRDFAEDFGKAIAASRWEDAARQAHTLKGLAGSLGAAELQKQAVGLERAARAGDAARVRDELAQTDRRLTPLIDALDSHFAPVVDGSSARPALAAEAAAPPASTDRTSARSAWFAEFRRLLSEADAEAVDCWESRSEDINELLPADVAKRISLALGSFEYDAVLSLLPMGEAHEDSS
jgi:CheY-like chemotaxis protein